jgi:hypothetical protein
MIQAEEEHPEIKLFLYMDSDAVIHFKNWGKSLTDMLVEMQTKIKGGWDVEARPMVFNQDGQSWWCTLVRDKGFKKCLNAGTVLWYRHPTSAALLRRWWQSTLDSYDGSGKAGVPSLERRFRLSWPWEQDRQMAMYEESSAGIQIASHPHLQMMPFQGSGHKVDGWCLSHLPLSGCFVAHHCSGKKSKLFLAQKYTKLLSNKLGDPAAVSSFSFHIYELIV